jgi:long-chain acyl-CoA synthetase
MATLTDILHHGLQDSPDSPVLFSREDSGWSSRTWRQVFVVVERIAAGLVKCGIEHGDKVAIVSQTRREWLEADLGILLAGAITVPLYPSSTGRDCLHILDHAESRLVFVENAEQARKLRVASEEAGSAVPRFVHFGGAAAGETSLEGLMEEGARELTATPDLLSVADRQANPDDVATIIYTSGTTGVPKGVLLTHRNFAAQCQALAKSGMFQAKERHLVYLPLSHIFARLFLYGGLHVGAVCIFAESMERLAANAAEMSPTYMAGVPRVYEKMYEKILARVSSSSWPRRSVFHWGLRIGVRYQQCALARRRPGGLLVLGHWLAKRLVYRPVHTRLGGKVRFLVSGGGSLAPEITEFFESLDIPLLNGYGLTETTALTTANLPWSRRRGSVGKPLQGTEVRLAADGEILVRGVGVMAGYFKNPQATANTMAPGGWLRTGDIGALDEDGFLFIVDRKKEILVTAGGKNIAPQKIENLLKATRCISNAMVSGDRRKYLVALITVKDTIRDQSQQAAAGDEGLREWVEADVRAVNRQLAPWETIKKFHVLEQDFSTETGELTPTLKLRRRVIEARHLAAINRLYADGPDLWTRELGKVVAQVKQKVQEDRVAEAVRIVERTACDLGPYLRQLWTVAEAKELPLYVQLFEECRDFASAAEIHLRLDLMGARAYDRAGDVGAAARLYEECGDLGSAADLYARHGSHPEAALLYSRLGKVARAMEMLRHVPTEDPGAAGLLLDVMHALDERPLDTRAVETLREFLEGIACDPREQVELQERLSRLERATVPNTDALPLNDSGGYEQLKKIQLFKGLPLTDLRDLHRLVEKHRFPAGSTIIEARSEAPGIVVLLDGAAAVLDESHGQEKIIATLAAGDFAGEISLLDGQQTTARVKATSTVTAVILDRDRFCSFLYQHPDAALVVYRVFAETLAARLRARS